MKNIGSNGKYRKCCNCIMEKGKREIKIPSLSQPSFNFQTIKLHHQSPLFAVFALLLVFLLVIISIYFLSILLDFYEIACTQYL